MDSKNGWVLDSNKFPIGYRHEGRYETIEKDTFVHFDHSLKDATSKLISKKKTALPIIENNRLVGQFSFLTLMKLKD